VSAPSTIELASKQPTPALLFATPEDWTEIDLPRLDDAGEITACMLEQFEGLTDDASAIAGLLGERASKASTEGICFAAIYLPGGETGADTTTMTVALPDRANDLSGTANGERIDIEPTENEVRLEPGPDQNAALLPAGRAARAERLGLIGLGPTLPPLPVFCVEYAVQVPVQGRPRFVVLTFTTIAPSDVDMLRAQFAEIASTLSFA
jgi:hypothetical protein